MNAHVGSDVAFERVKLSAGQVASLCMVVVTSAFAVWFAIHADNHDGFSKLEEQIAKSQEKTDTRIAKLEDKLERSLEKAEADRLALERQINALGQKVADDRNALERAMTDNVNALRASFEIVRAQMASLQSQQSTNVSRNEIRLTLKALKASNPAMVIDEFPF